MAVIVVLVSGDGHGVADGLPVSARSGRVLAVTETGELLVSGPDGRHLSVLSSLGTFAMRGLPSFSPAHGLVVFPTGQVLRVSAGPTVKVIANAVRLKSGEIVPSLDAFADHGRDVVVLDEGRFGSASVAAGVGVVGLGSGARVELGTGAEALGDPLVAGAFVAVAAGPVTSSSPLRPGTAESRVELRDAGSPTRLLATASQLIADVGLGSGTPVQLVMAPNPAGDRLAVVVESLYADQSSACGVVVLDRSGRVVAKLPEGSGPVAGSPVTWSPDGTKLAFVGLNSSGSTLTLWSPGGSPLVRGVAGDGLGGVCVWAPSGAAVLCDTAAGGGRKLQWDVAGVGVGPVVSVPAPGFPVAWLGTSGAG